MPFQSEKQRRFLHANHPEIAKRWERDYANGGISNHFRKRFFKGAQADTSGPAGGQAMSPGTSTTGGTRHGGKGGKGKGGDGPKPHSGPTAEEIAAAKAKAEAEKKAAELKAHKEWITKTKKDKKKKVKQKSKLERWKEHALFTEGLKTQKPKNYHQLGAFDFMTKFNVSPKVAKNLAKGYQYTTELTRALVNPFDNKTIKTALKTAKHEAALNALGIDAYGTDNAIAQEYAQDWTSAGTRKKVAHGGILDINESEEIISDDGNDIELTAYNAAFDDPNDLSTGVRTLFQAKDGGRIGFQGGGADRGGWGPGAGSPGTTSSGGNKNTGGGQYHGGGADVMAVSTPKSTYTGPTHSPHTDTPEQIAGQKEIDEAKAKRDFDYETEAYIKTVLRPQQIKTLTIMDKYENKIKPTYRDQFNDLKEAVKLGKNVLGATSSLFGLLSAGFALYGAYKKDKAFVNQLNKDIKSLKDMGIADFHHAVDTPVQTLEQLLTDRLNARLKRDDNENNENNEGPKPIYNPVTLEVDEEYAQGDYDFDQWSNWNAMKQKQLLNAQLQEQWRAEKEASDQSFLVANSGGLANLFRVKNNQ